MISQSWDGKRVYIASSLLGQLGQGRRRQRAVRPRLRLGRQGAQARLRGGLQQGEARARAPHEVRLQGHAVGLHPAAHREASSPRGETERRGGAGAAAALALLALAGGARARARAAAGAGSAGRDGLRAARPRHLPPLRDHAGAGRRRCSTSRAAGRALARFTTGKITVLSFIYTSCADARGCPLAYQVFHHARPAA